MRMLVAAGVLVSGIVHLKLWFDGFRDIDVIGPWFMLNAVAGAVIAALLLAWRHGIPLFLAVGFGASTLGAFVISATVGLFGVHERWTGASVLTAAVSEVVAILAGLAGLLQERPWGSRRELQDRLSARRAHLH
jgi:putative intracellular protease/amidase